MVCWFGCQQLPTPWKVQDHGPNSWNPRNRAVDGFLRYHLDVQKNLAICKEIIIRTVVARQEKMPQFDMNQSSNMIACCVEMGVDIGLHVSKERANICGGKCIGKEWVHTCHPKPVCLLI